MSQTANGRAPIVPEDHTSDDTLVLGECGTCHTNVGASGTVVLNLPSAADNPGLHYHFAVRVAQALRIDPNGTDTISLPSTGVPGAAGKYLGSSTIGSVVHLASFGGSNWAVVSASGSWAAEA